MSMAASYVNHGGSSLTSVTFNNASSSINETAG